MSSFTFIRERASTTSLMTHNALLSGARYAACTAHHYRQTTDADSRPLELKLDGIRALVRGQDWSQLAHDKADDEPSKKQVAGDQASNPAQGSRYCVQSRGGATNGR